MAISDSTLAQNVWDDVRSLLVSASIITTVGASTSNVNITGSYPDKISAKPTIVILPVMLSEGDFKFGGSYGKRIINVVIECWTDKTVALDQMADAVREAMKGNSLDGLNLVEISEDYAFNSPGENKMHLKTITFSYMRESHA